MRYGGGGGDFNENAVADVFRQSGKTAPYSGKRLLVYTAPKLFDLATRVLIDNMDELPSRIVTYSK